jgi:fibronectin type 3 domain-containing protein
MSWNKVKGADGYVIYRAGTKNGYYKYLKSVTTNTASHAGLKAGSKYYYKVRAYKIVNGKKIYGAYSDAKNMLTKPAAPTGFTVVLKSRTAKISWSKVTGVQGYEIYMSNSRNGAYTRIKNTGISTTAFNKTGLVKGKKYYFKMRAYTETGTGMKVYSGYSKIKAVTLKTLYK